MTYDLISLVGVQNIHSDRAHSAFTNFGEAGVVEGDGVRGVDGDPVAGEAVVGEGDGVNRGDDGDRDAGSVVDAGARQGDGVDARAVVDAGGRQGDGVDAHAVDDGVGVDGRDCVVALGIVGGVLRHAEFRVNAEGDSIGASGDVVVGKPDAGEHCNDRGVVGDSFDGKGGVGRLVFRKHVSLVVLSDDDEDDEHAVDVARVDADAQNSQCSEEYVSHLDPILEVARLEKRNKEESLKRQTDDSRRAIIELQNLDQEREHQHEMSVMKRIVPLIVRDEDIDKIRQECEDLQRRTEELEELNSVMKEAQLNGTYQSYLASRPKSVIIFALITYF